MSLKLERLLSWWVWPNVFGSCELYVFFFSSHLSCWWQNTGPLGALHLGAMTVSSWPFHWWVKHTQGPACLSCDPSFLEDELLSTDKLTHQPTGQQKAGLILTCPCHRATHRHCLAAVQGIDGCLGLRVWRVFHKCTPWKRKKNIREVA